MSSSRSRVFHCLRSFLLARVRVRAWHLLLLLLLGSRLATAGPSAGDHQPAFEPVATSPIIAELQRRVHSGDPHAVGEFWATAARRTTPLVEPVPGEPHRVVATFVWRDDGKAKTMSLLTTILRARGFDDMMMTRLPGTDVWYKVFNLRADFRFTYRFAIDISPMALLFPEALKFDPLNPKKLVAERDPENPDATVIEGSVAEFPEARPEPWITRMPAVAAGTVEMHWLDSSRLHNRRRIWTYLPPGYDPKHAAYPVLICFDGFLYASPSAAAGGIPAPTILDNLIAAHRIPPMVAIFVDSIWKLRNVEQTNHRPFVDFLAEELLPWARNHWNVTTDPRRTIVTGVSSGGLTSSYAALERPDVFGNVLSQSGAYWRGNEGDQQHFEWVPQQFEKSPKLPIRFVIQVGAGELSPAPNGGPRMVDTNGHLRDILLAKGYEVHFAEEPGAHEPISWRDGLSDGLILLAGGMQ